MERLRKAEKDYVKSLEVLSKVNGFCFDLLLDLLVKYNRYLIELKNTQTFITDRN